MSNFPQRGDTPASAPVGSSAPWSKRINYKAGKTPGAYAAMATPEISKCQFSYYDHESSERVGIFNFTFVPLANVATVDGAEKVGETYRNWKANFVKNTKHDILVVRSEKEVKIKGIYLEFKPQLPDGVKFAKYVIGFSEELGGIVAIKLTTMIEASMRTSVAKIFGKKPDAMSMYKIVEDESQMWAFEFTGTFSRCNQKGEPHPGDDKTDLFFSPDADAFAIRPDGANAGFFAEMQAVRKQISEYLDAAQDRIKAGQDDNDKSTETASGDSDEGSFPTTEYRAPSSAQQAPAASQGAKEQTPHEKFWGRFEDRLRVINDPPQAKEQIEALWVQIIAANPSNYGVTLNDIATAMLGHYQVITGDNNVTFSIESGKFHSTEDLPF